MDLRNFADVKAEKPGPVLWCNYLPSFPKLFRLLEFCLALKLLSWIFNRLPFAFGICSNFSMRIAGVIASPIFVFLLCNAIIATLIIKSGRFSSENPAADNAETQFYQELLKNNDDRSSELFSKNPPSDATEEVEYQDKQIISQANAITQTGEADVYSFSDSDNSRVYLRSKSDKLERNCEEKMKMTNLQRSETEKCIGMTKSIEDKSSSSPEEELNDEEFQLAVDEFIAKHLRFRRQEPAAFVLQN